MHPLEKLDLPEIRALLLQPPGASGDKCPENAKDVPFKSHDGAILCCRFYRTTPPDAPNLLYFHGGNESSDSFNSEAELYNEVGLNVFLTSLRGFGKSSGVPSIATLIEDAELQFSETLKWLTTQGCSGPIILMGRSLGSVCALSVAHGHQELIKALILESALCETIPWLQVNGIDTTTSIISEDEGFQNLRKIAAIKIPTMIFHGSRDTLVPIAEAEKLQAISGAKNKQFLVIPGAGHQSVSKTGGKLYFTTIRGFIDTVCGINTWRQRRRKFKTDQE